MPGGPAAGSRTSPRDRERLPASQVGAGNDGRIEVGLGPRVETPDTIHEEVVDDLSPIDSHGCLGSVQGGFVSRRPGRSDHGRRGGRCMRKDGGWSRGLNGQKTRERTRHRRRVPHAPRP